MLLSSIAKLLVFCGALILAGSVKPVLQLTRSLPEKRLRQRWWLMVGLILFFIAGYLAYGAASWDSQTQLLDLVVPAVFFLGAVFVLLTGQFALQTAKDLIRLHQLEKETVTDQLTGAFNRRYMDLRFEEEIKKATRHTVPLSLMLLDVDHFKQINDRFGHRCGDAVLVEITRIANAVLRENDLFVRYGGDEFVVILPHTDSQAAVTIARRLSEQVKSHDFYFPTGQPGNGKFNLTLSIGISGLGGTVNCKEKMIEAADQNLYRAKQSGRNRVLSLAYKPNALTSAA